MVTREPKTWMKEPDPSPRLQAELSSVQQPVETVRYGALGAAVAILDAARVMVMAPVSAAPDWCAPR
jgi:hypothetical protein